jgi:hypothetical protein
MIFFWETLHLLIIAAQIMYPWVTWKYHHRAASADFVYIAFVMGIYAHWVFFKNECIISYWEKKQIMPSYQLGDCPFVHPFYALLLGRWNDDRVVASRVHWGLQLLCGISLLVVLWRVSMHVWLKWVLVVLIVLLNVHAHWIHRPPDPKCVELKQHIRRIFT